MNRQAETDLPGIDSHRCPLMADEPEYQRHRQRQRDERPVSGATACALQA